MKTDFGHSVVAVRRQPSFYRTRTVLKGLLNVWPNWLWRHNLFGREGLEVAHLPRPMEEWRAKEWQLTQQTHSILGAALDSSFGA
jgi:hypothetical protein